MRVQKTVFFASWGSVLAFVCFGDFFSGPLFCYEFRFLCVFSTKRDPLFGILCQIQIGEMLGPFLIRVRSFEEFMCRFAMRYVFFWSVLHFATRSVLSMFFSSAIIFGSRL